MLIKIVEIGVDIEIKLTVNGINFYTRQKFETEKEAKIFLEKHGMKESK